MRNRALWPCASLALAAVPAALSADRPCVGVSASAIWQDNVSNATAGDGVLGAHTLEPAAAKGRYAVRPLGTAPVRGREEPVEIFAVDGAAQAPSPT